MSRRRGEFEHRTSIFEGAYRAWSHIGGCQAEDLLSLQASDLDPLIKPHDPKTDPRNTTFDVEEGVAGVSEKNKPYKKITVIEQEEKVVADDSWPYEPLPRSGIVHPFVQAIIRPWLGPDADKDDIRQGLTTLRTWWQHRRKGETVSAIQALAVPKLRGVVDGYMRHFFNLAHYMIIHDNVQGPKTLMVKLTSLLYTRYKRGSNTKQTAGQAASERQEQTATAGMEGEKERRNQQDNEMKAGENLKRINSPGKTFPIVCYSSTGLYFIALDVVPTSSRCTSCDYCKKIIEVILKGVHGFGPPVIPGLVTALAGEGSSSSSVLLVIDDISAAGRVSHEVIDVLNSAGYDNIVMKEIDIVKVLSHLTSNSNNDSKNILTIETVTEMVLDALHQFDQSLGIRINLSFSCTCFDDDKISDTCPLHSQINDRTFVAFDTRKREVLKRLLKNCPLDSYEEFWSEEEGDYETMEKDRPKKHQKKDNDEDHDKYDAERIRTRTRSSVTQSSSSSPQEIEKEPSIYPPILVMNEDDSNNSDASDGRKKNDRSSGSIGEGEPKSLPPPPGNDDSTAKMTTQAPTVAIENSHNKNKHKPLGTTQQQCFYPPYYNPNIHPYMMQMYPPMMNQMNQVNWTSAMKHSAQGWRDGSPDRRPRVYQPILARPPPQDNQSQEEQRKGGQKQQHRRC